MSERKKHIFLIHSHTTFLTSVGVIEKENLAQEDVIFILSRHYKNILPYNYKSFDFSDEIEKTFYIMFSWSRRNFFYDKKQYHSSVSFFDAFVENNAKSGFYLYAPQLQMITAQILATNPLCEECFFIQEGGRTMNTLLTGKIPAIWRMYNRIVLGKNKRIWKCINWFPNETTPYNKPITAYAFDKKFFGNAPQKTIMVKWPDVNVDVKLDTKYPIFLLEGAVELGQVEKKVYLEAVQKLINEYAEEKNYIKFHPKQSDEIKRQYLEMFHAKGVDVEELPMDVPFELILVSYKNLRLYGFGTSLLFYGKSFGHTVVSNEQDLMVSMRYRMYVKGLQKL